MRDPLLRRLRCVVLAALAACTHGEPFQTPDFGSDQPLAQTSPVQLTTSTDPDVDAAWPADEAGLLYTGDRRDVGDVRCFMELPPGGGRAVRSLCPAVTDTFNEFRTAAAGSDGRLAFVREQRTRNAAFPHTVQLAVAPPASLGAPTVLLGIPFTLPGPVTYNAVHQVRWLGSDAVIFRAGFDGAVCDAAVIGCSAASAIFVSSGQALVIQPTDPSAGGPVLVPGTDNASSVAVSADGDAIYYTVTGQGRVYRRIRSTGAVTVVLDRPGDIVRDVQVSGSRMVAVSGGQVRAFVGQGVGPVQSDAGGDLLLVDIGTGVSSVVSTPNIPYQHPALSPGGTRLGAESGGDLWLFNLP